MPRCSGRVAAAVAGGAPLGSVLVAVGGLYVAQSVVTGVTLMGLPAILRESGLPLERIGLVYLALLPWVLKCLWSGAVERTRLPPAGRPRIVALGTLISALAAASGTRAPEPLGALALLSAATAAFGFVPLYAEPMAHASPAQAGIDFTLFQCADALIALIALIGGAVSGVPAGQLGDPACFALAACASLAAAVAAARLIRRAAREAGTGRGSTGRIANAALP
ncbi:hypothetical protein [Methylorubrum zatmanii]|uniref:MFS transporter n=1 Tax=Methylorubrum zatmanii TaxID=29429 RepID=A0ABW1WQP8_9HYPH|nr:hypothetical protein [Methylorubrum zatmanii]MBD8906201.1 hypothetical protein [Methylorubrum zatmanii]